MEWRLERKVALIYQLTGVGMLCKDMSLSLWCMSVCVINGKNSNRRFQEISGDFKGDGARYARSCLSLFFVFLCPYLRIVCLYHTLCASLT